MMLSRFSAMLLDVNSTFMFGEDRFGPDHDYFATYLALGGGGLRSEQVREVIDSCVAFLNPIYQDPTRYDSFPQVSEVLAHLPASRELSVAERSTLERVLAAQEIGHIPQRYVEALQMFAQSHRLGIVSNIWSRKEPWIHELQRVEVFHLFESIVFSSDGPSMKPSPQLFNRALKDMGLSSSEVLFIGDSLRCDVGGAAQVGMATIWIDRHGAGLSDEDLQPDWIVRDLLELIGHPTSPSPSAGALA